MENEEVARILGWIFLHPMAWEILCREGMDTIQVREVIEILEELVSEGFYQMAAVLLAKLVSDAVARTAITNVVIGRITRPGEKGLLSEIVEELTKEALEKDIMNKEVHI